MTDFQMQAIGWVRGGRSQVEDDDWATVVSRVELDEQQFGPEAFAGLDGCSHVEVLFVFDQVDPDAVCRGARHPRGREDWPLVGIFAQRAKDRPNRIGSTVCNLQRVHGTVIEVAGLDAVDGTPVLDVKPYFTEFGPRGAVKQPAWAGELMGGYW